LTVADLSTSNILRGRPLDDKVTGPIQPGRGVTLARPRRWRGGPRHGCRPQSARL